MWYLLFAVVFLLLFLDLKVFHRNPHKIEAKESLILTAFYIVCSLLFAIYVWKALGESEAFDFLTGYFVEKSLSVDNLFVIAVIFKYFNVTGAIQHRILFWGVLGVVVLRGVLILAGAHLLENFHWVLHIFSALLIWMGIKMAFQKNEQIDLEKSKIYIWVNKLIPFTHDKSVERFFVRRPVSKGLENLNKAKWVATPFFLCLVMIELTDLIFALDSIPAIFTITTNPFIVFSSNIFAILGLRSLFFALDHILYRFTYLKYSLAVLLVFIGSKGLVAAVFDGAKLPSYATLGITILILLAGMVPTWLQSANRKPDE